MVEVDCLGRAAAGAFRAFLRQNYYEATGTAASALTIGLALDQLEARAQFDAPERSVHLRVADHAGCLYLDLADDCWRAVEIAPAGWRVIDKSPVRFRRPPGIVSIGSHLDTGKLLSLFARPAALYQRQTEWYKSCSANSANGTTLF